MKYEDELYDQLLRQKTNRDDWNDISCNKSICITQNYTIQCTWKQR